MRSRLATALTALTLALMIPAVAFADETGSAGRAEAVEVNTPSADTYLQYHGRIIIMVNKTPNEYRWGGTSCGSRTLTPDMVDLLVGAVESKEEVKITPRFQNGQGSVKCLVGFKLEHANKGGGNNPPSNPPS